jgi:hypothetical protein
MVSANHKNNDSLSQSHSLQYDFNEVVRKYNFLHLFVVNFAFVRLFSPVKKKSPANVECPQVLKVCPPSEQEFVEYCQNNNLSVKESSKWKLNYIEHKPAHDFNHKPILNDSLY